MKIVPKIQFLRYGHSEKRSSQQFSLKQNKIFENFSKKVKNFDFHFFPGGYYSDYEKFGFVSIFSLLLGLLAYTHFMRSYSQKLYFGIT